MYRNEMGVSKLNCSKSIIKWSGVSTMYRGNFKDQISIVCKCMYCTFLFLLYTVFGQD